MTTKIPADKKTILINRMTDNLPTLRARLALTQDDLADRIGVSRHTVMLMENRKRPMTWNTFMSCLYVFSSNHLTAQLLPILGVCDNELEDYLSEVGRSGHRGPNSAEN